MERISNIVDLPDDLLVEIFCWCPSLQSYTTLFRVCKRFEYIAHHKQVRKVVFSPLFSLTGCILSEEEFTLSKYKTIVEKVSDALLRTNPLSSLKETGLHPLLISHIIYHQGLFKNSHVSLRLLRHEFKNKPEFESDVIKALLSNFDFRDMGIDLALRMCLYHFKLPPSSQAIDIILGMFSEEYHNQNKGGFISQAENAYIMVHCLMLLNVDLWNPNVKVKMSCDGFISNSRGTAPGGGNYPREFLTQLYLKNQQFQFESFEESRSPLFENKRNILAQGHVEMTTTGIVSSTTSQVYCVVYEGFFYYFESVERPDPIMKIELSKFKVTSNESPFQSYYKFTLTHFFKSWGQTQKMDFTFRIATNYQWKRWEKVISLLL